MVNDRPVDVEVCAFVEGEVGHLMRDQALASQFINSCVLRGSKLVTGMAHIRMSRSPSTSRAVRSTVVYRSALVNPVRCVSFRRDGASPSHRRST